MPTFTITVTAAEGNRVMDALCASEGVPSTQSNAVAALRSYIVRTVKDYERNIAVAAVPDPSPVTPT